MASSGNLFAKGAPSENGLSAFERGTSTASVLPGNILAQQRAVLPAREHIYDPPVDLPCDVYPGDDGYAFVINVLRQQVADGKINCPWIGTEIKPLLCPNGSSGGLCPLPAMGTPITKTWLSQALARMFFQFRGSVLPDPADPTQKLESLTNAEWIGDTSFDEARLQKAILAALSTPQGFPSPPGVPNRNPLGFPADSWNPWVGTHEGFWFEATSGGVTYDPAVWLAPRMMKSGVAPGAPEFVLQPVRWPNKDAGDLGWNQSRPDLPYIQGWDPKENLKKVSQQGSFGTHLGHPFRLGSCHFIVWICMSDIFFEATNPALSRPFAAQYADYAKPFRGDGRLPPDTSCTGAPKSSTSLSGRGQWVIAPSTPEEIQDVEMWAAQ